MKNKKILLPALMFFQLCVVGAYSPIFSLYMKDYLSFTGIQIGLVLSLASLPSILSPFFTSWIVDRFITSRKLLAVCHIFAGILMGVLAFTQNYSFFLLIYFFYMVLLIPTFALSNTIVFHNIEDRDHFGRIRVWGTIGWIVALWALSLIWKLTNNDPNNYKFALIISSVSSFIVVLLTLMLPRERLTKKDNQTIIPKDAFKIMIKPEVILLLITVFISACADKFYFYGTPIFLQDIGFQKSLVPALTSIGQIPEIFMLFLLASFIKKLGFKNIFILALFLQIVRFLIFFITGSKELILVGVSLNGFIYALFYAGATIYLDHFTKPDTRGGVHQLFSMVTVGVAGLLGNMLAGFIAERYRDGENIIFSQFWRYPLIFSFITLLILWIFMKRIKSEKRD